MRFAVGLLGVEDLVPVPDLHLRRAAQIDAAVGLGDGLVFDEQLDVAELLVGRGVRSGAVVDQFTVLDGPVLRELRALLLEIRLLLLAGELGGQCADSSHASR